MSEVIISELNIYPVKSLRQISLPSSKLELYGLQHDRRWMVIDKQGVMLTQRQISRMCLIQPVLTDSGIMLTADGLQDIKVDIPLPADKKLVTVWDDQCQAYDAGEDVARWLSSFLGQECRLVYFPDDEFRQVDTNFSQQGDRTAFSDGFPLLLISQSSLDDLNNRLAQPVPMKRFRPNLVVTGCKPYAEDNWSKIRIGEISFRIVKPCSRCVIPTIDIDTAEKSAEPLKTLSSYRRGDNKVFFGQNVINDNEGVLTLGMPVEIVE